VAKGTPPNSIYDPPGLGAPIALPNPVVNDDTYTYPNPDSLAIIQAMNKGYGQAVADARHKGGRYFQAWSFTDLLIDPDGNSVGQLSWSLKVVFTTDWAEDVIAEAKLGKVTWENWQD